MYLNINKLLKIYKKKFKILGLNLPKKMNNYKYSKFQAISKDKKFKMTTAVIIVTKKLRK